MKIGRTGPRNEDLCFLFSEISLLLAWPWVFVVVIATDFGGGLASKGL